MKQNFLILDDDPVFASTLARSLTRRGFDATLVHTDADALHAASFQAFDFVTIDLHLTAEDGLQCIAPLRKALPQARLLVLNGYVSIATTLDAIKLGADNYLAKPVNMHSILSAR